MARAKGKKLESLSNTDIRRLIDEYIHNKRDREILKRRLTDGICYEPLAEEFGLSVRQVKNIVYKGESRIYMHLDNAKSI
jgi:hypothetical protein